MTSTHSATAPTASTAPSSTAVGGERADLLQTLAQHREFLRLTTRDLTDEQAARRTTVSELCLGGLIKHVASVERSWVNFILEGPEVLGDWSNMTEADWARRADEFRLLPGETLAGVLEEYAEVARRTDEVVATVPDLDASQPLPSAPWYEPGTQWSVRRVLLHIIAETSQHAGHADIIRESLDGAKSMG
ncbi:DinB family protein [Streptomyces sp. NPDC052687]|uniref:DinB family protein n=1 Tax=Streptomyces sp. NPDC052687 TaxID=3154759 RepID=UPI003438E3E5